MVVSYGVAKLMVAATEAEEDAEDQSRSSVVCMRYTKTLGCTYTAPYLGSRSLSALVLRLDGACGARTTRKSSSAMHEFFSW